MAQVARKPPNPGDWSLHSTITIRGLPIPPALAAASWWIWWWKTGKLKNNSGVEPRENSARQGTKVIRGISGKTYAFGTMPCLCSPSVRRPSGGPVEARLEQNQSTHADVPDNTDTASPNVAEEESEEERYPRPPHLEYGAFDEEHNVWGR